MVAGKEDCAKPATSCHLTYSLPPALDCCSTWRLDCTVVVHQTCPASYFCIVGWGPGGYSGIQEVGGDRPKYASPFLSYMFQQMNLKEMLHMSLS